MVVTPTASGKTLCYALPILQAIADDPAARALFLFPTKALGQDQVAEFGELTAAAGLHDLDVDLRRRHAGPDPVGDPGRRPGRGHQPGHAPLGDPAPPHEVVPAVRAAPVHRDRRAAHLPRRVRQPRRQRPAAAAPDLRPLRQPPGHRLLLGDDREPGRARRRCSPAGRRGSSTGTARRPASATSCSSTRRSSTRRAAPAARPLTLAQRWALPFLRAGRQTIVFGRSRVAVEILLTGLRESLRESYGPRSRVRGYRGGYLPTERRAIERGLRDGEILGVVATNALELGVDIGRLDVVDPGRLSGLGRRRRGSSSAGPGGGRGRASRSSSRRARRSTSTSSTTRSSCSRARPRRPASTRTTCTSCSRTCAPPTFELPFEPGEVFGPAPADDLLAFLAEEGHVRQAGDGRWYWSSENFPASEISLRTAAPENVVIIDTTPDRPRVLGEVDLFCAQVLVHERAIYIHESVQYYVDRLEWGERKAYVHRDRRRPLHVRQPRGDAQAARRLRRGAGDRRPADPRRGHGREPRHPVQEAQVRHRRERRLGPDRPARARAPDDRLLADRRGRPRRAGGATSSTSRCSAPAARSRRSPRSC